MSTLAAPAPSTGDQYPIHVGAWVNWSRGKVMGATLTVSRRDADLLIAFTSFFIAIYSTPHQQDVVYHQRQAILRNSSSPENAIHLLLKLFWSNHSTARRFRPLPVAIVAALCILFFTTAGGLSSQISTAIGSQVLLQGTRCGYISDPNIWLDRDKFFRYISYQSGKTDNAANYAQQCYTDDKTGFLDCNRLISKQIGSSIDLDAPCPFDATICRKASGNLRLDTGLLDSNDHFGLNAPPHQRIQWRHVLHCAPLETAGYTSEVTTPNDSYTLYHYGGFGPPDDRHEYTYRASSLDVIYGQENKHITYTTQLVESLRADVKNGITFLGGSNFMPINSLFRPDADTHLTFLSGNGVLYLEPTTDDWYRLAKTPTDILWLGADQETTIPVYLPLEPASPMGCTDQYQFCNTAIEGDKCGPLSSLRDAVAGAAPIFNTSYAEFSAYNAESKPGTLLAYFGNVFFTFDITVDSILGHLGANGLLSQRKMNGGIQGPIESNQWQLDYIHLWSISLAATQMAFIDTAVGPTDQDLFELWTNYTAPQTNKLCNSQKIRSTAYGSFSLFGLFIIFCLGFLLVITSYILEPVSELLCKKKGYKVYAHMEWTTNAALQLQRLAQEEIGMGTWHKCLDTIPTTEKGELLGSLDTTDLEHPVLRPTRKTVDIMDQLRDFNETLQPSNTKSWLHL
ncbi:hypothetical protein GQX73_g2781 [Xylaria multiplex]|uniref:Uncharacterized protein n=1 Tax=Xylaria multiplex TaxID=323545 RepID=A0A7C8MXF4_9PEZI|nr:hypothetical protein GQX73_g2781 [Xylaria multiplex]